MLDLLFFSSSCPKLITKSPLTPPKLSIHGGLGRGERPAGERERERSIRDLLYIEQSLSPGSSLDAGAPLLSLSRTTPPISVFFSSSPSSSSLSVYIFFFDIDVIAKRIRK
jgi:hypothetical protein